MNQSWMLADEVVRTVTGPKWHGPALADVLREMTHEQAAARPIDSVHTIWELVLHLTAWVEVARARLAGFPRKNVADEEDWPPVPAATAESWRVAKERLEQEHRALAGDVAALPDDRLDVNLAGHDYTARSLLHGILEHGTYHGGQIALLRKLVGAAS